MNITLIYGIGVALLLLILILLVMIIICFKKLKKITLKYEKLVENTQGESLDQVIIVNKESIRELNGELYRSNEKISNIQEQLNEAIQKTGFKRYNAFSDMGSNMSFSVAMLDEKNNGVILSSLYGRDGCSMYGKSVEIGKSPYPLSEEELEVLNEAIKK